MHDLTPQDFRTSTIFQFGIFSRLNAEWAVNWDQTRQFLQIAKIRSSFLGSHRLACEKMTNWWGVPQNSYGLRFELTRRNNSDAKPTSERAIADGSGTTSAPAGCS